METTTAVSNVPNGKADIDAQTRMLNAKARQAKAEKPATTDKPVTAKQSKPAEKAQKQPVITLASKLDSLIKSGGKWADLVAKANEEAKAFKATTKYTTGVIKAHIRYRVARDPKYLGDLTVTDAGIERTKKAKK